MGGWWGTSCCLLRKQNNLKKTVRKGDRKESVCWSGSWGKAVGVADNKIRGKRLGSKEKLLCRWEAFFEDHLESPTEEQTSWSVYVTTYLTDLRFIVILLKTWGVGVRNKVLIGQIHCYWKGISGSLPMIVPSFLVHSKVLTSLSEIQSFGFPGTAFLPSEFIKIFLQCDLLIVELLLSVDWRSWHNKRLQLTSTIAWLHVFIRCLIKPIIFLF